MKKIIIAICVLLSFVSEAQVKQQMGTYGFRGRRIQSDSAFRLPLSSVGIRDFNLGLDTAQLRYDKSDSAVKVYTGFQWLSLSGGSSTTPGLQAVMDANNVLGGGLTNKIYMAGELKFGSNAGTAATMVFDSSEIRMKLNPVSNQFITFNNAADSNLAILSWSTDPALMQISGLGGFAIRGYKIYLDDYESFFSDGDSTLHIGSDGETLDLRTGKGCIITGGRPRLTIDSLNSGSAADSIMTYNDQTKQVHKRNVASIAATNIYNSDGTLTGDRAITGAGNDLEFTGIGAFLLETSASVGIDNIVGNVVTSLGLGSLSSGISAANSVSLRASNIFTYPDSILLNPSLGVIKIDTVNAFADTTNFKPLVINTTGTAGTKQQLYRATYWPGGGGASGITAGNYGNVQLNRNGAFATPGSDSLDFDAGLMVKGSISSTSAGGLGSNIIANATGAANYASIDYVNDAAVRFQTGLYCSGAATPNKAFFFQASTNPIGFFVNSLETFTLSGDRRVGIRNASPAASLDLPAGLSTAGFAPLKFTSGTNLSSIENGAVEYNGSRLFVSSGGTRQNILQGLSGSFSQVGTATTVFTVTFGGTQPNATYQVLVTPTAALSAALFYVTNKTTTTFDVTYLAGLTGTVTFDWILSQ